MRKGPHGFASEVRLFSDLDHHDPKLQKPWVGLFRSPLPEPQRLAIAERELLDAEALGLQDKVAAFVQVLQAAGLGGPEKLPDVPEARERWASEASPGGP